MKTLLWITLLEESRYLYMPDRMAEYARHKGLDCEVIIVDHIKFDSDKLFYNDTEVTRFPDIVFFREYNKALRIFLYRRGVRCINSLYTIDNTYDKLQCHKALEKHGIVQPKFLYYTVKPTFAEVADKLGLPFVMKDRFGSNGTEVFLVHSQAELDCAIQDRDIRNYFFQEYISAAFGKDVRAFIIGGKIVASYIRVNEKDFRGNFHFGAKIIPYEIPEECQKTALRIVEILKGEILSVDFMPIGEDHFVFCESNTNAFFVFFNELNFPLQEMSIDYIVSVMKTKGG